MSKNLSLITRGACHTSPYENVECIGTCVMAFPFSGGSRTDLRGQGYEDSAWFFLSSSVPLTHRRRVHLGDLVGYGRSAF